MTVQGNGMTFIPLILGVLKIPLHNMPFWGERESTVRGSCRCIAIHLSSIDLPTINFTANGVAQPRIIVHLRTASCRDFSKPRQRIAIPSCSEVSWASRRNAARPPLHTNRIPEDPPPPFQATHNPHAPVPRPTPMCLIPAQETSSPGQLARV